MDGSRVLLPRCPSTSFLPAFPTSNRECAILSCRRNILDPFGGKLIVRSTPQCSSSTPRKSGRGNNYSGTSNKDKKVPGRFLPNSPGSLKPLKSPSDPIFGKTVTPKPVQYVSSTVKDDSNFPLMTTETKPKAGEASGKGLAVLKAAKVENLPGVVISVGLDVEQDADDGGHVGPVVRGVSPALGAYTNGSVVYFTDDESDYYSSDDEGGNEPPATVIRPRPSKTEATTDNQMLAAVDMGTNSFHMVIVKADQTGRFQIEDVEKEDVRLGSGSAGFSLITPDAEERALAAVKRFKKIALTRKAAMRVVATSAVREARNRRTFCRRVLDTTGVDVEVLSGREEACMIYLGVLQALPVFNKTVLCIDIGGGSTEFVIGREGKPLYATSLKLGHIRLTERFVGGETLQRSAVEEMRKYIRIMLADSGVLDAVRNVSDQIEVAIGSSGTIETIEQMVHMNSQSNGEPDPSLGRSPSSIREASFSLEDLTAVVKKIVKAKTAEARSKIPGLAEKRADVIVGGAVLLEEIFRAMEIQRMEVSPYALREGVIVDTLSRTCDNFRFSPDLRKTSVMRLAEQFNVDRRMESALHSAQLGWQILAGLQTCKMGGQDCIPETFSDLTYSDFELLEASTILHYVGMFISHKSYHKHSHYLIKHSEHLLGFSPLEIEVISLLVKYHRKKVPSLKDEDFAKLPEEVQRKIRPLVAILRLSVALDRCETKAVEKVHVLQDVDSCILVITPASDPATGQAKDVQLELWAAQAEVDYFEKIFRKPTSLVLADHLDADQFDVERSQSLSS